MREWTDTEATSLTCDVLSVNGRDVHRRSDRLHQNVLLHLLQNVVGSWRGCSAVLSRVREVWEG